MKEQLKMQNSLFKKSILPLSIILLLTVQSRYVLSQINIKGSVISSVDQQTPIDSAHVRLYEIEIAGQDTIETLIDSTYTDLDGKFDFQVLTGLYVNKNLIQNFDVTDNYPNPFTDETNIDLFIKNYLPNDLTPANPEPPPLMKGVYGPQFRAAHPANGPGKDPQRAFKRFFC